MGFDVIDGELWDEETGEYAGPASGWISGDETPEDLALLVMRKRMDIEANILAEKAKMDAVVENFRKMIGKHQARLEWLEHQYNAQLQDYAMSQLPRKADGTLKAKTWTCPFGTVAFRTVAPKVAVEAEETALEWARKNCPAAIKLKESILVSQLPEPIRTAMLEHPEDAKKAGFVVHEETQAVTIKTIGDK
jgi:phage host-nuclease inhibitor protein Gam